MQPRQVKFLREADRPKESKPLGFTDWINSNGGGILRTSDTYGYQMWGDKVIDNQAEHYAAYLATFGDKKPVEITHYCASTSGWNKFKEPFTYENITEVIYIGKCKEDGDVFCTKNSFGGITYCKGFLNSGTY